MIRELYNGQIVRSERASTAPEYLELSDKCSALISQLEQQLTPEQISLFNEACDALEECSSFTAEEMYVTGFRDAARLMIELLIE